LAIKCPFLYSTIDIHHSVQCQNQSALKKRTLVKLGHEQSCTCTKLLQAVKWSKSIQVS
jgi:uncharacterized OsmC-like protein